MPRFAITTANGSALSGSGGTAAAASGGSSGGAAWMRVQLMADTTLRPWFHGPPCNLCTDAAWQVTQKMMDQ